MIALAWEVASIKFDVVRLARPTSRRPTPRPPDQPWVFTSLGMDCVLLQLELIEGIDGKVVSRRLALWRIENAI